MACKIKSSRHQPQSMVWLTMCTQASWIPMLMYSSEALDELLRVIISFEANNRIHLIMPLG